MAGALSIPAHLVSPAPATGWRRVEDLGVGLCLATMVALPLLDAAVRAVSHSGASSAAAPLTQHLCLVLGMAGGALAARDERLLGLAPLSAGLAGRIGFTARVFSHGLAAAVTLILGLAAWAFVWEERAAGNILALGIPRWWVELSMPAGFALIAARLLWNTAGSQAARISATVLAIALMALGWWSPVAPEQLVWPALALLGLATALGAPVFVTLGGAAVILFWGDSQPLAILPIDHYGLVVNATLPTIPLFTLAGCLLAESGASRRLVRVFQALAGWFPGGPAITTALVCAFFTSFTGGSGVTILALGGLLMPVLIAAKFTERDALGMITGAGSLGILLPPCLPVILYAIIANVDIRAMFLAGLVPALLLIALTAAWGVWAGRRATGTTRFDGREALAAIWSAKWELALPLVALGALFGGWTTPVEAAALTAFYALLVVTVVHRDLRFWQDCPRVFAETGLLVGGIFLILGVALGLTNWFLDAQVPDHLAAWAMVHVQSRWLFLLGLNLVLIVMGGLVEIYAGIIVLVPLLVPIGTRLGLDPLHLGVIFLANMELGFLAPPVGLNLLLSSTRLRKPLREVTHSVLPLLAVMFAGVLLITYFPTLTTALPNWLR